MKTDARTLFTAAILALAVAAPHAAMAKTEAKTEVKSKSDEKPAPKPFFALTPERKTHEAPRKASKGDVTEGSITVSDYRLVYEGKALDISMTLKNKGKVDDVLIGAGTGWESSGVAEMMWGRDGKPANNPLVETIPAGKSLTFSHDDKWLRFSEAKKPKIGEVITVTLYFRRAPNLTLNMPVAAYEAEKMPAKAKAKMKAEEKSVVTPVPEKSVVIPAPEKSKELAAPTSDKTAKTPAASEKPAAAPKAETSASATKTSEAKKKWSIWDWFKK
ncbi:MAG: copper chaperone PCu(A)C [Alphaproteobacteria bacterium]|nr:copper chaperone PCu(A)C [Alphaproteobacteria bacterium]